MSATRQTHPDLGGAPYRVPAEPRRWPAVGLALGVHAMLLGFLAIGVSWQNTQPVAVEAEVWDLKTQTAAPPPPRVEPEPEPETPPAPREVEPPRPVEAAVERPVEAPKPPDIALEREKKRKDEQKRKQQLAQERQERLEREAAEQKRVEEKKASALAEKKERERAEKKARELEEKKAAEDQAKKEAAEKKKKEDADKKKAEADKKKKDAAEQKKLDDARAAEMRRITGAAGNPAGSSGNAEKSSAPRRDAGYIAAITAKVKGNAAYGGDDPGNPVVTFHVEQLPTGDIMSVKKTKGSGIPAFDDAIERAIKASSPLPKKKDGTVERSLEINFHMKDMQ